MLNDEDYKKHQQRIQEEFYDAFPLCFPKPPYCGFSCGEGWFGPLKELCKQIEPILAELPEKERHFQVAQVKEKFGGLRFYTDGPKNKEAYKKIQKLVSVAESECSKLCEDCGAVGTRRNEGWIKMRCDECEKKHQRQRRIDERKYIIIRRAQKNMDDDWEKWSDLSKEEKAMLLQEAEEQLLSEGGIRPIEKY